MILDRVRRGKAVPCAELSVRTLAGHRRAVLSTLSVVCHGQRMLVHVIHPSRAVIAPDAEAFATGTEPQVPTLTPRRREILALVAEGLSTREIAERLVLSPYTVRNHLRGIFAALRCHSRLEAVAIARRAGLL